ncbi:MAG: maleate cis-trans isomerase family protein [Pseudomonadales bacterium]
MSDNQKIDLNRNVIDSSHVDHVRDVNFDDENFPDAMGWRGKIGVLTPAPNTIVENEYHEMAPRGVINIVNRYYVPNQKVRSDEDWMVIMKNTRAHVAGAVESLVQAKMDHLIMGMSSESFMGGVEGSMALRRELKAAAGGNIEVTVGAEAAELAFDTVGAKRIALLTPYYPVVDKNAVAYFTERGFKVVAVEGLKCKSIIHVGAQGPDTLIPATKRLAEAKPDAIIQLGTNLRYAKVADEAERWLDIPTFSVGTAIYWAALRKMGINDKMSGFGSLLEHY